MSWLQLDDRILEHPKFVRAVRRGGSAAVHLWLGMMSFCKQRLTDGLVPADMVDVVAGPATRWRKPALVALVEAGLLESDPSGYRVHDYLRHNDARETVERRVSERRARDEARRLAYLARNGHDTETITNTETITQPVGVGADAPPKPKRPRVPKGEGKPVERKWRCVAEAFPEWQPNDLHAKLALKYGKVLQVEAAKFRDHEFKTPKTNPDRTFNNWLRPRGDS